MTYPNAKIRSHTSTEKIARQSCGFPLALHLMSSKEGPEGVKWEQGTAYFVLGKGDSSFHSLGFFGQKSIGNGNEIKI